jgi:hypothetical protein
MMRAALLGGALIAACSSSSGPASPKPGPEVPRAVHVDCTDGPGMGRGMGPGAGKMGRGEMGGGMGMGSDMGRIHQLLGGHDKIARKVVELPDGIESWTTSSDPAVAATLGAHLGDMVARMKQGQLIHGFDPLFRKVFAAAPQIEVTVEPIAGGVHVIERGKTPEAIAIVRAHAQLVSWMAERGFAEAHRCHDVAPAR